MKAPTISIEVDLFEPTLNKQIKVMATGRPAVNVPAVDDLEVYYKGYRITDDLSVEHEIQIITEILNVANN